MRREFAKLICVFVVMTGFLMAPSLNAQVVPYKASGTDTQFKPFSMIPTYSGTGQGAHLGRHEIIGKIVYADDFLFYPDTPPGVFAMGNFTGSQEAIAANGDILASNLSGYVVLVFSEEKPGFVEGMWCPTFEIDTDNCTGRFKKASGTIDGVAINPPFDPMEQCWPFDWYIDGEFDLGKKGKK